SRVVAERDRANRNAVQSEKNYQHALQAADTLVAELAEGIKPITGTQSPTVEKILQSTVKVYDDLLQEGESPAVLAGKGKMLIAFADTYLDIEQTRRSADSAREALALSKRLTAQRPPNIPCRTGV